MATSLLSEKKSLFFFLTLSLLCAFHFFLFADIIFISGLLIILVGLFGFFRFIHLSNTPLIKLPKVFNLPSQIIFGVQKLEQKQRSLIFERYMDWDVLFFIICFILFTVIILFNSFFPADVKILLDFRLSQESITPLKLATHIDFHAILGGVGLAILLALLALIALSYGYKSGYLVHGMIILLPLFVVSTIYFFMTSGMTSPVLWPDISQWRGVGLGQSDILLTLYGDNIETSISSLTLRFMTLGFFGAYGVYLLYLPALFTFLFYYRRTSQAYVISFIGLSTLMVLFICDALWHHSPFYIFVQMIGLYVVALCWGAIGYHPRLLHSLNR